MTTAELKPYLIERIIRTDDLLLLRTLHEVLAPAPYLITEPRSPTMVREETQPLATDADWEISPDYSVDDEEVTGVRPDGRPVTAGAAVKHWDESVAEVLAGGDTLIEELIARFGEMARKA